jgi:hypothetical protein
MADRLERRLKRELGPGEHLVWWGQPGRRRFFVFARIAGLVFFSIWTLAALLWTGFTFDQGWLIEPFEYEMDRWLSLAGAPFILVGFGGLFGLARSLYLTWATAYGLTNVRILILKGAAASTFRAADLRHIELSGDEMRGTLRFAPGPIETGARPRGMLLNIDKPGEVERLIRSALLAD